MNKDLELDQETFARAVQHLGTDVQRASGAHGRKSGQLRVARFDPAFVRRDDGQRPGLIRLVSGEGEKSQAGPGRGGLVRLRLYLCMVLMAPRGNPRFSITSNISALRWAERIGLTGNTAASRIRSNMRWLEKHRFIEREPRPPSSKVIHLLDVYGGGKNWEEPPKDKYVGLRPEFFTQGWLLTLDAVEVALWLILNDHFQRLGGRLPEFYVGGVDRRRYKLSSDGWTVATKGLVDAGLITVRSEGEDRENDEHRTRQYYTLNRERLLHPPTGYKVPMHE